MWWYFAAGFLTAVVILVAVLLVDLILYWQDSRPRTGSDLLTLDNPLSVKEEFALATYKVTLDPLSAARARITQQIQQRKEEILGEIT